MDNPCIEMGVPLNHPFIDGLSIKKQPFWGTPHVWKSPYVDLDMAQGKESW
jgi:hypothetical protein